MKPFILASLALVVALVAAAPGDPPPTPDVLATSKSAPPRLISQRFRKGSPTTRSRPIARFSNMRRSSGFPMVR